MFKCCLLTSRDCFFVVFDSFCRTLTKISLDQSKNFPLTDSPFYYVLEMNGANSNNETRWYLVEKKIVFSISYLAILLVELIGNSFVIHVARKLLSVGRGPFNILVINMAASDILYALTAISTTLRYKYIGDLWFSGILGTFFCKFSGFAQMSFFSSSILTLTAMTVDRYLAIVPDVKKPLTRKNVLKATFVILFFSFGWCSFQFFKWNTVSQVKSKGQLTFCRYKGSGNSDVDKKLFKAYSNLTFIFLYVLPVIVMTVLYFCIIWFLWLRKIPGNRTNQNNTQRRKHLRKVTWMLVTMATTFVVTWLPLHVYYNYLEYDNIVNVPSVLQSLLMWFSHTNCATNPCFYFIFIKEYREKLRSIGSFCKYNQRENRSQDINLQ